MESGLGTHTTCSSEEFEFGHSLLSLANIEVVSARSREQMKTFIYKSMTSGMVS